MATLQQLITRVEITLAQSAGSAVQTYAQPRIANYIQTSFDSLFLKIWWPQYMTWQTLTLNGTDGKPTVAPSVSRFMDYRVIYQGGSNKPLTLPPIDLNPNTMTGVTSPQFVAGVTGDRVFQVYPFGATGTVDTHGRVYPAEFGLADQIDMDATLLTLLSAWHYCVDDGNNPAQAEKLMQAFNTHFELICQNLQNAGVSLDYRMSKVPTSWGEWA